LLAIGNPFSLSLVAFLQRDTSSFLEFPVWELRLPRFSVTLSLSLSCRQRDDTSFVLSHRARQREWPAFQAFSICFACGVHFVASFLAVAFFVFSFFLLFFWRVSVLGLEGGKRMLRRRV
jgi:hypothetical protein